MEKTKGEKNKRRKMFKMETVILRHSIEIGIDLETSAPVSLFFRILAIT